MPASQPVSLTPSAVFQTLRNHAWLWIAPAIAGLVLTAVTTLATPRKWKATLGLIVRSETAGYGEQRLGKFDDVSEMRTAQETILEVARSRHVLSAALQQVGPAPSWFGYSDKPSLQAIESLRERLRLSPPGGAEFGKTEVFYLSVLDKDSQRAVALADAIGNQLESRLQELRNQQADSMTRELTDAVTAARGELNRHTDRLTTMELEVGADLADLRNLVSPIAGRSALAEKALALEAELRETESGRRRSSELLATLQGALDNPGRLLATPSALLASQPALQRLKDGLVDAQIRAASLESSRSSQHPFVAAAKETEHRLREALHREIPAAIAGVELELTLNKQREAALRSELTEVQQRGAALAGRRAEYSLLISAVENQTRLVDASEAQLADARSHAAGAKSSSVLERVDTVEAAIRPVGPGRATITLAGGLGGLILGVGLVFSFFGPQTEPSEDPLPHPNQAATNRDGGPRTQSRNAEQIDADIPAQHWTDLFPMPTSRANQSDEQWSNTKIAAQVPE